MRELTDEQRRSAKKGVDLLSRGIAEEKAKNIPQAIGLYTEARNVMKPAGLYLAEEAEKRLKNYETTSQQ